MNENRVPTILEEIYRNKDKYNLPKNAIDTVTASLSFMMIEIGRNKDVQRELYDEIIRITNGKNEQITAKNIEKMVFLKAIVKETYR